MSIGQTAIANQALSGIGAKVIQDINLANDVRARKVQTVFDQSIRELGEMQEWKALKARRSLPQDTTPDFGWGYSYRKPERFLRIVSVNGITPERNESYYDEEGDLILTDAEECKLVYIQFESDTSKYDNLFIAALVKYLEAKLAMAVNKDKSLHDQRLAQFEEMFLDKAGAKAANSQRGPAWSQAQESLWASTGNGQELDFVP